jgi:hypothetical protein
MSNSIGGVGEDKYLCGRTIVETAAPARCSLRRPLTKNHKDVPMTDQPSTGTASSTAPTPMQARAEAKMLRAEIGNRWDKFTQPELDALRNNDDLVAQLVAKYGLGQDAATREAAALVRGRAF